MSKGVLNTQAFDVKRGNTEVRQADIGPLAAQ